MIKDLCPIKFFLFLQLLHDQRLGALSQAFFQQHLVPQLELPMFGLPPVDDKGRVGAEIGAESVPRTSEKSAALGAFIV